MTEETDVVEEFEYTSLMEIEKGKSNLAIHVSNEWIKGFVLVNTILAKLGRNEWEEIVIDGEGNERKRIHIDPQLLPWAQERRRVMEQYWKISGGEAVVEGKKEVYKNMAKMIFESRQDKDFIEEHEQDFIDVLEEMENDD